MQCQLELLRIMGFVSLEHIAQLRSNRLYGDILKAIVGRFGAAALTFVKTILLVRLLAPEMYGHVAVVFSWGYIISSLFEVGAGSGFIALESKGDVTTQTARFWSFMRFRLGLSLMALSLGLIGSVFVPPLAFGKFYAALLMGLGLNVCHSPEFYYQAQKRFTKFAGYSIWVAMLILFWTAWSLWLFKSGFIGQVSFWLCLGLSTWFAALVAFIGIHSVNQVLAFKAVRADAQYFGEILRFGKWIALTGIVNYWHMRYGVILLGGAGRSADAAAFDVAFNFAMAINLLAQSAVYALSPRFASLTDWSIARKGFIRILKWGTPLVMAFLMLYYSIGAEVVVAIFGADYRASVVPLNALMPSFLILMLSEPIVAFMVYGVKKPSLAFWVALGRTIFYIFFGYWDLQRWGIWGLALLYSFSRIAEHALLVLLCFRFIKAHRLNSFGVKS